MLSVIIYANTNIAQFTAISDICTTVHCAAICLSIERVYILSYF